MLARTLVENSCTEDGRGVTVAFKLCITDKEALLDRIAGGDTVVLLTTGVGAMLVVSFVVVLAGEEKTVIVEVD